MNKIKEVFESFTLRQTHTKRIIKVIETASEEIGEESEATKWVSIFLGVCLHNMTYKDYEREQKSSKDRARHVEKFYKSCLYSIKNPVASNKVKYVQFVEGRIILMKRLAVSWLPEFKGLWDVEPITIKRKAIDTVEMYKINKRLAISLVNSFVTKWVAGKKLPKNRLEYFKPEEVTQALENFEKEKGKGIIKDFDGNEYINNPNRMKLNELLRSYGSDPIGFLKAMTEIIENHETASLCMVRSQMGQIEELLNLPKIIGSERDDEKARTLLDQLKGRFKSSVDFKKQSKKRKQKRELEQAKKDLEAGNMLRLFKEEFFKNQFLNSVTDKVFGLIYKEYHAWGLINVLHVLEESDKVTYVIGVAGKTLEIETSKVKGYEPKQYSEVMNKAERYWPKMSGIIKRHLKESK